MAKRLLAAVIMACCSLSSHADATTPRWALDPSVPGADLPTEGRSLFDLMTADGVPFPFEALVRKLERQSGCKPGQCVSSVLIPLGRSLQRVSAAPDFFASPRVVVAVTGEGASLFAKDRMYLGYQERTNLIEVISYNEAAGRFEFQLVRDYRAGGAPEIAYAARAVCTACHQNHAPIFSRQIWDETNANPRVAAALAGADGSTAGPRRTTVHGVPIQRGVEVPNAIDDATDRANLIGVIQRIWREACDSGCRALALTAALQYRLSGERAFEIEPPIAAAFAARWPGGLAIPNPDIPNRDPLALAPTVGTAQADVRGALEPLAARAPIAIWKADDPLLGAHFVAGLAAQIPEADMRELDSVLRSRAKSAQRRNYTARCAMNGTRYDCAGEVTLRGDASTIEELTIGGKPLRQLRLNQGSVSSAGRRARTAAGDSIERVTLTRGSGGALATVTVVEDFAPARTAIARADWSDEPFRRERLRAALGLIPVQCCAIGRLPPAREDIKPALPLAAEAEPFAAPCARCHRTPERAPPNFLAGDGKQVRASLAQCAPRIFVRLAMWQTPESERAKVPMPPPGASHQGAPMIQSQAGPEIAALQASVAAWLRAETGRMPDVAAMLAGGYENLRPCLPPGS
jgi:hypothetical protein